MWNSFDTGAQDGLISEVIGMRASDGEWIHAYWARPAGPGPYPGIVAVHHLPGWDEFYREFARRLASHGYSVVCPDLYCRYGHGTPDDIAARERAAGGLSDDGAVGDLVADLWGGRVVATPGELNDKMPVAPLDYTKDLTAPVLGLFGNEDANPSPEAVSTLEAELAKYGKAFEFHRYDGAGHGFFYYDRPNYRQQQAMDGWGKVFGFFDKHLS
jgi:carboxymethylenebutenolidase